MRRGFWRLALTFPTPGKVGDKPTLALPVTTTLRAWKYFGTRSLHSNATY